MSPVMLQLELLGRFRLLHGDLPVQDLQAERLQSLLAYLALNHGTPQPRQHIAFSFWPDSRERQAMGNLRNVLHRLRKALPDADDYLTVDARSLCWRSDAPFSLDVRQFERGLAAAGDCIQRADGEGAVAALEEAVALYRGDLLVGLYDDWILPERERLHHECTRALEQLVQLHETERRYGEGVRIAQRLLQLDPLREPTYRMLMRLHALNADRASARRTFEQCVDVLARELDLEPEPATVELWEQISTRAAPGATDGRAGGRVAGGRAEEGTPLTGPMAGEGPAGEGSNAEGPDLRLVGRQDEWKRLRSVWSTVERGQAAFVVIAGEAGIGKTRLAEELLAWTGRQGIASAGARCYAAEGRLAYAPIVEWLRTAALRENLDRLAPIWRGELARLLPELEARDGDRRAPEPLREGWQRQRLFEALARAVLASGRPLCLVLDDLQWCDQDTLEWIRFLFRFGAGAPLLVAGTVRVEEVGSDHPVRALELELARSGQLESVALSPLDAEETAALAGQVAGRQLGPEEIEYVLAETEGNPLFVVESVRAGATSGGAKGDGSGSGGAVERGSAANGSEEPSTVAASSAIERLPSGSPALPARVRAVLTRRLAQLSPKAQTIARLAAASGRSFTFEVLGRAGYMDEEALVEVLEELLRLRVVRDFGSGRFDFTHDKLREAAYAETPPVRRRLLHRRLAEALEAEPDADAISAQVAAHYDLAGMSDEAIASYQRAAAAAERVGSYRDAVRWLRRADELLDGLPSNHAREANRLSTLVALGLALRVAEGHAADPVGAVFERAWRVCGRAGDDATRFVVRRGLWSFHLLRGEYDTARRAADELLSLGRGAEDAGLELEALVALGLTLLWCGELVECRSRLEEALALYDAARHAAHARRFGQDPGVAGLSLLAYAECLLGAADRSQELIQRALDLAEDVDHPFSRAYALQHAMLVEHALHRGSRVRERAAELLELSRERGFTYWIGPARIGRGWALAKAGQAEQGEAVIREGIAEHGARGAVLSTTLWTAMLAETLREGGRTTAAVECVDEALRTADRTGERIWEAELYRLKGDLLVGTSDQAARSCLERALETSRRRETLLFELRAAVSLGRLMAREGRTGDARELVRSVADRFPRELESPDLAAADRVLEQWA